MQRDGWRTIAAIALTMAAAIAWRPSASAADEPEMVVELNRTKIYEGESVLYRVTLNHVENPREPSMKALDADFHVVPAGQQSMDSRSITIVNGQMSSEVRKGRQYNYRLTPRRTGTLTIPAPTVKVDGQELRGRELTLVVLAPSEQDVVRMQIRADRKSVYPMQPFIVTLSIAVKSLPKPFDDKNPVAVQSPPPTLQIPWAVDDQLPAGLQPKVEWRRWLGPMEDEGGGGFNVNNLGNVELTLSGPRRSGFLPPFEKVRLAEKSGNKTTYWRYEFRRTFVATKVDRYTFGPASLKGAFATTLDESGQPAGEDVYAVAKPLVIDVQDVPLTDRPDCYIGAVGTFRLAAELEPKKVKTGDPMTLTLTLDGEGTLDSATPPDLNKLPDVAQHFKIYDATEQAKRNQRQFTYSLRPLDVGIKEFPAVPAAYFDVDAGRYVTLHTDPIPIEVSKAVRMAGRDIIESPRGLAGNSRDIEMRRGGIFANITDPSQLGDQSIRPERWLVGMVSLAGIYAALAIGVGRWRRIRGDTAMLRRRAATGAVRRRLREAASEFAAGHPREGADYVLAAALGLVADMLGLPAAGMTSAEACRQLATFGVEPELIGRLRSLTETCEAVRYGASADDCNSLGHDAGKLLHALAAALRKKKSLAVFGAMLLAMTMFGGCGKAADLELAAKFQAAQQAFDDARKPEEFAKVAMLDQEILDRGGMSGAVLYNQGNAWMQAGQPGRAVAAYRLAQRYLPRDPFLDANLRFALGPDAPAAPRPIVETIVFWQNWLSYPEKFYLAAAAALATFGVAVVSLLTGRRAFRRAVWVGLALTGIAAFSAAYDWQRFDATQHGVVIQPETIARKGNGAGYEQAFNEPLREATEFGLIERRGEWLLIRLPGDGEGWIPEISAVTY